jgi:hypothetical protein
VSLVGTTWDCRLGADETIVRFFANGRIGHRYLSTYQGPESQNRTFGPEPGQSWTQRGNRVRWNFPFLDAVYEAIIDGSALRIVAGAELHGVKATSEPRRAEIDCRYPGSIRKRPFGRPRARNAGRSTHTDYAAGTY